MTENAQQHLFSLIEQGRLTEIENGVTDALDAGFGPEEIISIMVSALRLVGEQYQKKVIFLNEMLLSAMAMQRGINMLKPYYSFDVPSIGTAIIGTVQGDIHDVGKNLVSMMLQSSGIRVIDLGVNVSPERFAQEVAAHPECRLLCLSALLTTTLPAVRKTVQAIESAGLREQVLIMVGGGSVTSAFASSIGADAYTEDAAGAMKTAVKLLQTAV